MSDEERTGLERFAPGVVATLSAFPALTTFLAMSNNVAAATTLTMSLLGSGISYVVNLKVEEALREGLAKVNRDMASLRSEGEWAALTHEERIEHLSRTLSPEQTEQVGAIMEQMFRSHDGAQQQQLLALVRSVGSGPKADDVDRRKVIAEMTTIGPAHIKALVNIHERTKFSFRGGGRALDEDGAKNLALESLRNSVSITLINALEGAGFVRVETIEVPERFKRRAGVEEMRSIQYAVSTDLGRKALDMLGHRV